MISDKQAQIAYLASDAVYGKVAPSLNLSLQGYDVAVDLQRAPTQRALIVDDPNTGFHAEVYQKAGTKEYLVAFTGTQGGQDALSDITLGISQWKNNMELLISRIGALTDATKIKFTGNSLGGLLAQYASYEYLKSPGAHGSTSLITFNAPGAMEGLQRLYPVGFDSSISAQIDAGLN